MKSNSYRLDRLISQKLKLKRSDVRLLLAQKRIKIDGQVASSVNQQVTQFSKIVFDDLLVQNKRPVYLALNKPKGCVSATKDKTHRTVMDVLEYPDKEDLHIAGRLDLNSTGLLLLSNDGFWSRNLFLPQQKIKKRYRVQLEKPISQDYVDLFRKGIYFAYEGIHTQPSDLHIIDDFNAEVSLIEGRYHQIKRMFGHFQNKVINLDRFAIGSLVLDDTFLIGETRILTADCAEGISL